MLRLVPTVAESTIEAQSSGHLVILTQHIRVCLCVQEQVGLVARVKWG